MVVKYKPTKLNKINTFRGKKSYSHVAYFMQ